MKTRYRIYKRADGMFVVYRRLFWFIWIFRNENPFCSIEEADDFIGELKREDEGEILVKEL